VAVARPPWLRSRGAPLARVGTALPT